MKIGIYGGTFNPPHLGHMAAAKAAVAALNLDKLLLIPAAVPPHKELPEGTASGSQRLEMVEKMADAMGMPKVVEVSSIELDREGKSYTADTLAAIHEQYPDAELWLLMGTDMFLTLHQWYKPEEILKLAGICAFGRTEEDGEEVFAPQRAYLTECFGAKIATISLPGLVEVSSTQLREQLEKGEGGKYLLPAVYGYILMNGLYGTKADLKHLELPELRACSYSMMKAKRVPHVMGVEEESIRLAKRWGVDPELARHAGILHDCTKYLELGPQLEVCAKYGVELDDLERQAVKLLHSKTGACIAREVFGEPDEVYEAIFWHTTAKEDMSTLDKILYMADYIEPNRDFDGVERLRALAYEDLDKALLLGVETTIQEMEERRLPIHNKTLTARDWLRRQVLQQRDDEMNDQNNRQGKRVAASQKGPARKGYWQRYKAWLAGLTRGERIRYRILEVATIIAALIIVAYLGLSAWIRMPSLPGGNTDPSQVGDLSDLTFDGAETPDIAKSGRKDGIYTILLVGKDVASGSTDTMLLLSYDTKAKTVQGLNLPRDTMVNVSTSSKRLNAVFSYNKGKDKATQVEKGMAALKKQVANLTGITPDYYALVEWKAIGELVDALGGVEFEVPFDMDYDDPYQDLHIHQKAGLRKLSGDDAMQVIRHRKNNDGSHSKGDVGRLKIQQDFLKAVAKKCLQPATFLKIPALAEIFTENVTTDLSVGNIIALAQKAYGMDPETGVNFQTAPLADNFYFRGAALVTLDADGILEIVNSGMNPYLRDIEKSDLQVVYRNSNGSFGVTSGTLADPKMGSASSGSSSKPSKPVDEEPDLPIEPIEPEEPLEPEVPEEPGDISQGGDGSQGGNTSQGGSSSSGGQLPPEGGDSSQGGDSAQPSEPSQDVPPAGSAIVPPIDPSQVLPDPNADAEGQAA